MSKNIIKTNHAVKRGKERPHFNKATMDRLLPKIYDHGVTFEDSTGRLKSYFSWLYLSHEKSADNIRIYGRFVYIFQGEKLITILPLQKQYYSAVSKIQKRKEEVNVNEGNGDTSSSEINQKFN
jgi:hypothetical protein